MDVKKKKKLEPLPWDLLTIEDEEEEEEEKKEAVGEWEKRQKLKEQVYPFQPKSPDEVASKEEYNVTWRKICFSTALATFFAKSKNEWYSGQSVSDGNCGPDTIRIALGIGMARKPFFKLVRLGISKADLDAVRQVYYEDRRNKKVLEDKNFLYGEELIAFCLKYAQVVPILIINTYEPYGMLTYQKPPPSAEASELQKLTYYQMKMEFEKNARSEYQSLFVPCELYYSYIPLIKKEKKDLKYVVFKNVGGNHWVPWGVKSRKTGQMITIFSADNLPEELLRRFQEHIENTDWFLQK